MFKKLWLWFLVFAGSGLTLLQFWPMWSLIPFFLANITLLIIVTLYFFEYFNKQE
jgi:hypothetical protein